MWGFKDTEFCFGSVFLFTSQHFTHGTFSLQLNRSPNIQSICSCCCPFVKLVPTVPKQLKVFSMPSILPLKFYTLSIQSHLSSLLQSVVFLFFYSSVLLAADSKELSFNCKNSAVCVCARAHFHRISMSLFHILNTPSFPLPSSLRSSCHDNTPPRGSVMWLSVTTVVSVLTSLYFVRLCLDALVVLIKH